MTLSERINQYVERQAQSALETPEQFPDSTLGRQQAHDDMMMLVTALQEINSTLKSKLK